MITKTRVEETKVSKTTSHETWKLKELQETTSADLSYLWSKISCSQNDWEQLAKLHVYCLLKWMLALLCRRNNNGFCLCPAL